MNATAEHHKWLVLLPIMQKMVLKNVHIVRQAIIVEQQIWILNSVRMVDTQLQGKRIHNKLTLLIYYSVCISCPVGQYCPTVDIEPLDCPIYTYANYVDRTYCETCESGTTCNAADKSVAAVDCSVGTYHVDGTDTCWVNFKKKIILYILDMSCRSRMPRQNCSICECLSTRDVRFRDKQ
jgi:hypothetical protein